MENPCYRMPICDICEIKRPGDIFQANPVLDMSILGDIFIIIKTQKAVGGQLPIGHECDHNQKEAHNKF